MGNLINLNTNLKSLPYGKNTLGEDTSPFITKNINEKKLGAENLIELNVRRRKEDVERIGKWFSTTQGTLFIAKQQVLAATGPKTEASQYAGGFGGATNFIGTYGVGMIPSGLYYPTQTIDQVAVSGTGLRFQQKGQYPLFNITKYYDIKDDILRDEKENRLIKKHKELYRKPLTEDSGEGPRNFINRAADFLRDIGILSNNNIFDERTTVYWTQHKNWLYRKNKYKILPLKNDEESKKQAKLLNENPKEKIDLKQKERIDIIKKNEGIFWGGRFLFNLIKGNWIIIPNKRKDINIEDSNLIYHSLKITKEEDTIERSSKFNEEGEGKYNKKLRYLKRKRYEIIDKLTQENKYLNLRADEGLTDWHLYNNEEVTEDLIKSFLDQIHLKDVKDDVEWNEDSLIKFGIEVISPEPEFHKFLEFRAYLDPIKDSYNASWQTETIAGRAEEFFRYNGFSRSISFGFQVPVNSQYELKPQYEKLKYLASLTAPTYGGKGFMRGNIVKLTIGNYVRDLPGIIRGVSLDIQDNTSWDVDNELPMLIKVNNFSFSPIHPFLPETGGKFIGGDLPYKDEDEDDDWVKNLVPNLENG